MFPVKCNGLRIGYAEVSEGKVTALHLAKDFSQDFERGVEYELTIELEPTITKDEITGDINLVYTHFSSKFTW